VSQGGLELERSFCVFLHVPHLLPLSATCGTELRCHSRTTYQIRSMVKGGVESNGANFAPSFLPPVAKSCVVVHTQGAVPRIARLSDIE
jgi:hypothetical protein